MSRPSLQSTLKDIVQRIDTLEAMQADDHDALRDGPRHEALDFYLSVDPLLAELNKIYMDTLARENKLLNENGSDDPMAVLSKDLTDSARSALQTRLLELQEQEEGESERALKRKRDKAIFESLQAHERLQKRKEKKADSDFAFWMYYWMWVTQQTYLKAKSSLSLINDFENAGNSLSLKSRFAA